MAHGGGRAVRARGAAALAAVIALTATGCSPELRPLVAVYVDEHGTPRALLRSCEDDGTIRGPFLDVRPDPPATATEPDAASTAPEDPEPPAGWWAEGDRAAEDIPLFSPPAHWDVETRGPQTLRPGVTYELSLGDPGEYYAYAGEVSFTAADLAALPPGRVLALDGETTRDAFEERARDSC
ncbi:hypothetical protein AB0E83_15115 [Streptomyces sp. NPDC035033]|uniref:hypothetical protein n=1 Tax=Streptomyces sp. NPDC035033 TaxID=3155368 RepID=UPI0033CCF294